MATRYWVGGTGTWNATTTHWSATSGGSSGASVPTLSDDVIFDSASNATSYTITLSGSIVCNSLTITGPASGLITVSGTSIPVQVNGNLSINNSGVTWSAASCPFTFGGAGSKTINTGTKILAALAFDDGGAGGSWTLNAALNTNGNIVVTSGSFSTSTFPVTCANFTSTGVGVRTINLGSSTITITSNTFNLGTTADSNLTFNAGTSTITSSFSGAIFIGLADKTAYNVTAGSACTSISLTSTATTTFNNLTVNRGTVFTGLNLAGDITVNGTFSCGNGVTSFDRVTVSSSTAGTPCTITAAAVNIDDVNFQDITGSGAATWTGTRLGDIGGNSNITFATPKTVYWVNTGGGTWGIGVAGSNFASTSGGAASNTLFPLPQDTVIIDNSSLTGSPTITVSGYMPTVICTRTTAWTLAPSALCYGNFTLNSSVTLSGASNISFRGYNGQTITSAGRTFPMTFRVWTNNNSTVTIADALSVPGFSFNTGVLDLNNQSVSCTTFSFGVGTKTLTFGSSVITCTGATFNASGAGDMTLNAGTGKIIMTSASAKTFTADPIGLTWPTLENGGAGTLSLVGSGTFANLTSSAVGASSWKFPSANTTTLQNFSLNGSSGNVITFTASTAGSQALISMTGTVNTNYINYKDINVMGGVTWNALKSNGNVDTGNNSGINFGSSGSLMFAHSF